MYNHANPSLTTVSNPEEVNSVDFNQDNTCLALSTSYGYRIFSIIARYNPITDAINNRDMVEMLHSTKVTSGLGVIMARMLYCTSLLVLVYAKNPKMLVIEDASMKKVRCERVLGANIVRIELNRARLAVLTADGILQVFDLGTMKLLISFSILPSDTPKSVLCTPEAREPGRFFVLSTATHSPLPGQNYTSRNPWLVCRDPECVGAVKIYNCSTMKMENIIKAHHHEISQMVIGTVDADGSDRRQKEILATSSMKGTLIRLWSLPACTPLRDLRRGMSSSMIYSLAINAQGSNLAVSSSTGTIHIFNISNMCLSAATNESTVSDIVSESASSTSSTTNQSKSSKFLRSYTRIRPWKGEPKQGKLSRNSLVFLSTDSNDRLLIKCGTSIQVYEIGTNKAKPSLSLTYDLMKIANTEEAKQFQNETTIDM